MTRDPLGFLLRPELVAEFTVLGLPARLRTNSSRVLQMAEAALGPRRQPSCQQTADSDAPTNPFEKSILGQGLKSPCGGGAAPREATQQEADSYQNEPGAASRIRLTVLVQPGPPGLAPSVHRVHEDSFLAAHGSNLLTARLGSGEGLAFVTPEALEQEAWFRHHVLECLALLLASRQGRTPVHAASVVRQGHALLLAGASGAGKSTLCYACVRAGFELLAEDVTYLGAGRAWGHSTRLHLLPDAIARFPELSGQTPSLQPNGKLKLAVRPKTKAHSASRISLCLLRRHDQPRSWLEPLAPEEAWRLLQAELEPGFDIHRAAYEAFLWSNPAFRLHLGTDLEAAVQLLANTIDAPGR